MPNITPPSNPPPTDPVDLPPANMDSPEEHSGDFDQLAHETAMATMDEDEYIQQVLALIDQHLEELGLTPVSQQSPHPEVS